MGHIAYEIRSIGGLLLQLDFSIQHIFREANRAADYNTNLDVKETKFLLFSKDDRPRKLNGISRIDRAGLFDMRILKM